MVARFWLGLFFMHAMLHAQEDPMNIKSGEAVYDGKKVVLIGDVVMQHGLGQISAHRVALIPASDKEKKHKNSSLEISESVEILLNGGGRLECQRADVDYTKMKGVFSGNVEFPDVVYCSEGEGADLPQDGRASFEVKSSQMTFDLMRELAAGSSSPQTRVRQIEAVQNVRVGYDKDHLLVADHALYERLPASDSSALAGLLTLSVKGPQRFCQLTNVNGDCLNAKTIQVNTLEKKLWLGEPEGKLLMREEKNALQTLEFKSDELSWDHHQQILILKGGVEISQNGNLHVKTDNEISIAQANLNGKRTLRSIQSPQQTQITYMDASKNNTHSIYCPGPLMIDHERQEMTLNGLADGSDSIEDDRQVYIEDVLGEMYADLVLICYQWEGSHFNPKKVTLEGHVRLLNRFNGHMEEAGSVLHYALADRVVYSPEDHEMVLSASESNRVLLFDKVNNIQMSAPSLKIQHDASTQKDLIKGMGDVRFTFLEKELAQFKQHFKQKDALQEGADHGK